MRTLACDLVDVIPATSGAHAFILDTFAGQVGRNGYQAKPERDALARILRGGQGRALVAVPSGFPDELVGWAIGSDDNGVLFVYVRDEFRRQGIGGKLLGEFATESGPVRVAYWTESARLMAVAGFPVRYDARLYSFVQGFVRRSA